MGQWELSPDGTSYSVGIGACAKGVEWVVPFELLKEMRQWDLSPDVTYYSAAVSMCETGAKGLLPSKPYKA